MGVHCMYEKHEQHGRTDGWPTDPDWRIRKRTFERSRVIGADWRSSFRRRTFDEIPFSPHRRAANVFYLGSYPWLHYEMGASTYMNNIPKALRAKMAMDPFYRVCCVTGAPASSWDRIEWHHNLIFAHKQVQAEFAILPIKQSVHNVVSNPLIKERLDWVMLNRASESEIRQYSKVVNLARRRAYLNDLFGSWNPHAYAPELA